MKELTIGTPSVPASGIPAASETVNALTEQVNNLQHRYYRTLAPDCEVRTKADRWYFRAVCSACFGLLFPPLFIVTAVCVYKAKKCREGGEA